MGKEFDIVRFANKLLADPDKLRLLAHPVKRPEPKLIFTKRGLEEHITLGQITQYRKERKKYDSNHR